jgi:hypothetical protein
MNLREPPPWSAGARRALRCLSLLLLPAIAPSAALSIPRPRSTAGAAVEAPGPDPVPYLPAFGALPLRFQRALPPPDLVTKPAAGAPPVPALSPTESTVAQANTAAAQSAPIIPPVPTPAVEPKPAEKPARPKPAAPSILPDDTRPTIRPEDFLPFFQIPGSAKTPGDVNLVVPASFTAPTAAPLPPSSATYTQTPK